jgi:hypothetical protein
MDYLVMIENAMSMHNLLSCPCLKVIMGGVKPSPNCNQQRNILILDSTILSCCLFLCNFGKVTKSVYPYLYSIDKG